MGASLSPRLLSCDQTCTKLKERRSLNSRWVWSHVWCASVHVYNIMWFNEQLNVRLCQKFMTWLLKKALSMLKHWIIIALHIVHDVLWDWYCWPWTSTHWVLHTCTCFNCLTVQNAWTSLFYWVFPPKGLYGPNGLTPAHNAMPKPPAGKLVIGFTVWAHA